MNVMAFTPSLVLNNFINSGNSCFFIVKIDWNGKILDRLCPAIFCTNYYFIAVNLLRVNYCYSFSHTVNTCLEKIGIVVQAVCNRTNVKNACCKFLRFNVHVFHEHMWFSNKTGLNFYFSTIVLQVNRPIVLFAYEEKNIHHLYTDVLSSWHCRSDDESRTCFIMFKKI